MTNTIRFDVVRPAHPLSDGRIWFHREPLDVLIDGRSLLTELVARHGAGLELWFGAAELYASAERDVDLYLADANGVTITLSVLHVDGAVHWLSDALDAAFALAAYRAAVLTAIDDCRRAALRDPDGAYWHGGYPIDGAIDGVNRLYLAVWKAEPAPREPLPDRPWSAGLFPSPRVWLSRPPASLSPQEPERGRPTIRLGVDTRSVIEPSADDDECNVRLLADSALGDVRSGLVAGGECWTPGCCPTWSLAVRHEAGRVLWTLDGAEHFVFDREQYAATVAAAVAALTALCGGGETPVTVHLG